MAVGRKNKTGAYEAKCHVQNKLKNSRREEEYNEIKASQQCCC